MFCLEIPALLRPRLNLPAVFHGFPSLRTLSEIVTVHIISISNGYFGRDCQADLGDYEVRAHQEVRDVLEEEQ